MFNFTKEQEEFLKKRINKDNEKYIKALIFYFFVMDKTLSYENIAKILNMDYIQLLDTYDDLKVSTSEITLPSLEKTFIESKLAKEGDFDEINKKENISL